jgi:hypothetical protein
LIAEILRAGCRRGTRWIAAGFFAALAGLAVLSASAGFPEVFLAGGFLAAPTLFAPLAAAHVTNDRASGMALVHTASPRPISRAWTGPIVVLSLGAGLGVGLAIPVALLLLAPTLPQPWTLLGPYLAWTIPLAASALLAGIGIGHVAPRGPRRAVAGALGLAVAWVLIGWNHGVLVDLLAATTSSTIAEAIGGLSPLTWALQATVPGSAHMNAPRLAGLAGCLGPSLAFAIGAFILQRYRQDALGFSPDMPGSAWALTLGIALATAGALTIALVPDPADPPRRTADATRTHLIVGGVRVDLEVPGLLEGGDRAPATMDVRAWAEEPRTIEITDLDIDHPRLNVTLRDDPPIEIDLEPIDGGEANATGTAEIDFTFTAQTVEDAYRLGGSIAIGDQTGTFGTEMLVANWQTDGPSAAGAALADAILLLGAGMLAKRRLQR